MNQDKDKNKKEDNKENPNDPNKKDNKANEEPEDEGYSYSACCRGYGDCIAACCRVFFINQVHLQHNNSNKERNSLVLSLYLVSNQRKMQVLLRFLRQ